MKMSKLGYFAEFLIFPPLVVLATLICLSRRGAAAAGDVAAGLCRRTGRLDPLRIFAASFVISSRAGAFGDPRPSPSFAAGVDRHAGLGEPAGRGRLRWPARPARRSASISAPRRRRASSAAISGTSCPLRGPPRATAAGLVLIPRACAMRSITTVGRRQFRRHHGFLGHVFGTALEAPVRGRTRRSASAAPTPARRNDKNLPARNSRPCRSRCTTAGTTARSPWRRLPAAAASPDRRPASRRRTCACASARG